MIVEQLHEESAVFSILTNSQKGNSYQNERDLIFDLIDNDLLTTHFQPIYNQSDGYPFGFEALTRITDPSVNIDTSELFDMARNTGLIQLLDGHARHTAYTKACEQCVQEHIFINMCPETLVRISSDYGLSDLFGTELSIPRERIVLEVTEESAVKNYVLFARAIEQLKRKGYKIAIDDFGAGYGGLKMLSIIEPDFVKIDRHFISDIDTTVVKYNLVDAIVMACHRLGIKVIAEGVERDEEMFAALNFGIEYFQGYLLAKPAMLAQRNYVPIPGGRDRCIIKAAEDKRIGDLAVYTHTVHPQDSLREAYDKFINNQETRLIPVVRDGYLVGTLNRREFLELQVLGKCGYGVALNHRKTIEELMEKIVISIDSEATLEDAARRIQARSKDLIYDDVCVTHRGKYYGTVPVSVLLGAMTEKTISLARNANPLTGLPGNDAIFREVNRKFSEGLLFDVCYIDLDNFKPFNDNYGFDRGDVAIRELGRIILDVLKLYSAQCSFVGHIGGDDFIVIADPGQSEDICSEINSQFKNILPELHGNGDYQHGYYFSKSRKGDLEKFPLLSISIGIVSTASSNIDSYQKLAQAAAEVKKTAKMTPGFSIFKERRAYDLTNI
ncbi:bifunctional diguanylate cyclase/phosphodiesterase [Candidatus Magnetomonas plexicatena]|uniref:bifunctional diguanylate cyclase/phosphodiesterase n=1 Tax=Candidatus Magnetomonas plexicatena TaxID=2552947 RepID=UPI001C781AB3|nr:GGDEF domain-containing protein [Nitrospirales bacterium LBB_01]